MGWLAYSYVGYPGAISVVPVPQSFELRAPAATSPGAALAPGGPEEGYAVGFDAADTFDPELVRVAEIYHAGRVQEALSAIRTLVADRPSDPKLRNNLGVYLARMGDTAGAEAAFEAAIRVLPGYARAQFNLGTLRLRSGRQEEALEPLGQALNANAYYGEARLNRALALTQLGKREAAARDYEFLIEADRSGVQLKAYYNMGLLHAEAGRNRAAIDSFTALLRRDPDHQEARFNKALIMSRAGLEAKALSDYEKILELNPVHEAALLNVGAYLFREGKWKEAAGYFERLLEANPNDPRSLYNLGLCHALLEDDAAAVSSLRRAIELDPSYAEAHYNLGLAHRRLGDLRVAIDDFQRAVALRPDQPQYHYNLALTRADTGEFDGAEAAYQSALDLDADYFKATYNLGLVHYRSADYELALAAFERAKAIRPDSYEAAYNLGLTLLKLTRLAPAELAFRAALALEDSTEARYNLGLTLQRQERYEPAEEQYRAVLREDPKHVRSVERLAESLSRQGRHTDAIERLYLLQKLDPTDPTALNTGLQMYQAGDLEAAALYFDVSATGSPGLRARSWRMKSGVQRKQGRSLEAEETLQAGLRKFPRDASMRRSLARLLSARDQHGAALGELEALRRLEPEDSTAYKTGFRLYRAGDLETALRYFEIASQGSVDTAPKSLNMTGLALRKLERKRDALAVYEGALERFPGYQPILRNVSVLENDLGAHDAALRHLAPLQKQRPDSPTAFNMGLSQYRSGSYGLAGRYFEVGAQGAGDIARKSLNMRALAAKKLGRDEQAIAFFEEGLQQFPSDAAIGRNLSKALIARGRHTRAIEILTQLRAHSPRDPKTLFLLGKAHLALGNSDAAASYFDEVLAAQPDHAGALRRVKARAAVAQPHASGPE